MFDRIIQLFQAKIWRNCSDVAKKFMNLKWLGEMTLPDDAFGTSFNVIMTSQNNVKSNACYTMTSVFARGPVTGISKSHVLTAHAHEIAILIHGFLFINIQLLISCDTGIYAILTKKI